MKRHRPSPYGIRARPPERRPPATTAQTVLIVDDDREFRGALATTLENRGYRVDQSSNGVEALDQLRWGLRPNLILLDLRMRVMTGWEFRTALLQDPQMAGIPLVAMTAGTWKNTDASAFTRCIRKPLDVEELCALIDSTTEMAPASRKS